MSDLPNPEALAFLILPIAFLAMIAPRPDSQANYGKLSWPQVAFLVGIVALSGWMVTPNDILNPPDGSEAQVTLRAPWLFSNADHP